jgi:hypothetical protein
VLSPVLFTHYTNDHRGEAPHTYVVKYADDTAILGLIGKNGEGEYRNTVETFVRTCDGEGLILNVGKTKEMVVDFRKKPAPLNPLLIKGEAIETCKSYKYLGLTISDDLTWEVHVDTARKKAMKKIYHLRTLKRFNVSSKILATFYNSTIASSLTYGISVWGGACTNASNARLQRLLRTCRRVIGEDIDSIKDIYHARTLKLCNKILKDQRHPLHSNFNLLPSNRRFRNAKCRTTRMRNSFVPCSIRFLNQM